MEVEHHLRRGRPLAAFSSLLSTRIYSYTPQSGRQSSSYDSLNFLLNLTESEESLIASVRQHPSRSLGFSFLDILAFLTLEALHV